MLRTVCAMADWLINERPSGALAARGDTACVIQTVPALNKKGHSGFSPIACPQIPTLHRIISLTDKE